MVFSLVQPLIEVPLVCVDVETTGASAAYGDRVIEVGAVRYENGQEVARYAQLVDPGRRVSGGITALTGITNDMLAGQPRFADQLPALLRVMEGAAVLGHNVRFDLSFLSREFQAAGLDLAASVGQRAPVFDTVRIARRRFGRGGNGLQVLSRRLGIEPATTHRALADAITTAQVFERLLEPAGGWTLPICDVMTEQGGPMNLLPTHASESELPLELQEALDARKPVMMEYLDARQLRTWRRIDPLQVRRFNGSLILIAHCHLRNDRRTFKLDRVVQLVRLEDYVPASDANASDDHHVE